MRDPLVVGWPESPPLTVLVRSFFLHLGEGYADDLSERGISFFCLSSEPCEEWWVKVDLHRNFLHVRKTVAWC